MKRLTLIVTGEVQGVGFRYRALQAARSLGLTGFVRNKTDCSVEIVAEGSETALEKLERQMTGSFSVRETQKREEKATEEFSSFEIKPTQ
jgi:acylphosphatase